VRVDRLYDGDVHVVVLGLVLRHVHGLLRSGGEDSKHQERCRISEYF